MVLLELKKLFKPYHVAKSTEAAYRWLLTIVLIAAIYRFCWIDAYDPFKCGALLHKGEWLDAGSEPNSNFQKWQPPGCLIHEYQEKDIHECLGGRRLLFAGDTITRQIFWAMANKLDSTGAKNRTIESYEMGHKHEDLSFVSNGVTLDFVWDPYLNTSALERELRFFSVNSSGNAAGDSAALILLGAPGLWYARSGQENYMRDFRHSIDRIIPHMDHIPWNASTPNTYVKTSSSPNILLLAPIQVPRYESLSSPREATITPEKVDSMNEYLQQTSAYSNADVLWSYSRMTSSGEHEYLEDGLHVIENVARAKAEILLNLRCNNDAAGSGANFTRTCCSDYGQTSRFQLAILLLGMLVVPALLILRQMNVMRLASLLPQLEMLKAFKVLGLVVCYCYFTDRTQLFDKIPKHFLCIRLLLPFLCVVFVGLAFVRKSTLPILKEPPLDSTETNVLSREMTNEWKGWMQAIILIYHYVDGSEILWFYQLVQVLVASYLFMTGFGHTLYFLQKQDYSLKRVSSILVRLNLLACVLPFMMRSTYMSYNFAPLVSFWFVVLYATLRITHEKNEDMKFLFGKMVISCTLMIVCTIIPGVCDTFSWLLQAVVHIPKTQDWDVQPRINIYIVYIGMIVAILLHRTSKIQAGLLHPETRLDTALAFLLSRPVSFKLVTITISPLFIWIFWLLQRGFGTKEEYNTWHPYISILPILGYIGLRNSLQIFRAYHSTAFAALGRCALETWLLQHHLLLAADGNALLGIGVWDEKMQVALLGIGCLWVSWLMRDATGVLTTWIVGGSTEVSRGLEEDHGKDSPRQLPIAGVKRGGLNELYRSRAEGAQPSLGWRVLGIVVVFWGCNFLSRW